MNRREFLRASTLALGSVAISTGLQGCFDSESSPSPAPRKVAFNHGVASGDPLHDRVIIWTRLSPPNGHNGNIQVSWEVAADPDFTRLVHNGSTHTGPDQDYTVKVDVLNLAQNSHYYYRFRSHGLTSPRGRTKTLPAGEVNQVRFAVMSCSNYPAGYFHAYAEAARIEQLDAVIHLGDYIYEYGMDGYATDDAHKLGRALPEDNDGETLNLDDYRKRYALYRTDKDLQTLHAAAAFIAVWDDHEISNDTWRESAQNHSWGEGGFSERKLAALQAWFEWMPIRPASRDDREIIYRSFDFGNLLSLHMLDTRVIGRDLQLTHGDYYNGDGFDAAAFSRDTMDGTRRLLGERQFRWLDDRLRTSVATWQVLGQQVLMGSTMLPRELLSVLQKPSGRDQAKIFDELIAIKLRLQQGDPTLTAAELRRVQDLAPFNLDAWDGYAYARTRLLELTTQLNRNLVVLAGDSHNAWASNLLTADGVNAGVEFATPSVSSPGMESYLAVPLELMPQAERAITTLIESLQYLNAHQRGYLVMTFTPNEARGDWHFIDRVTRSDYAMDQSRRMSLAVRAGGSNRRLIPPDQTG